MLIRTVVIAGLVLAVGANAQNPGPGRGRNGRFGPDMAGGPPEARLIGAVAGRSGQIVKNAPYSADVATETTQMLADGNRIRQTSTAKLYRDSEGRVRNEQSLSGLGALAPNTSLPIVVFINDPVAKTSYALNQKDKTASKSGWGGPGGRGDQYQPRAMGRPAESRREEGAKRSEGAAGPWRPRDGAAGPNIRSESLGRQTIEGVPADGIRTIHTIPAGQMGNEQPIQIVSERWYSPDLQLVVLAKQSDPRVGETVFRLTNISRAEPPATLFQPPADYKVTEAGRGGMMPQQRGARQ